MTLEAGENGNGSYKIPTGPAQTQQLPSRPADHLNAAGHPQYSIWMAVGLLLSGFYAIVAL
jgi:hypothetical protein